MEILVLIVAAVFILGAIAYISSFLQKPKTFICAGCGKEFKHTERTLEARKYTNRFYCSNCHHKWLENQPKKEGCLSGCASWIVLIAVIFVLIGVVLFFLQK